MRRLLFIKISNDFIQINGCAYRGLAEPHFLLVSAVCFTFYFKRHRLVIWWKPQIKGKGRVDDSFKDKVTPIQSREKEYDFNAARIHQKTFKQFTYLKA